MTDTARRRWFEGLLGMGDARHDFAKDFGWPTTITMAMLRKTYERNAIAHTAVKRTAAKTWRDSPKIGFGSKQAAKGFNEMAARTRLFQRLSTADARAQVQGFSAILLRVADGLDLDKPLGTAKGYDNLVGVHEIWGEQLTVVDWDENILSKTYGEPLTFSLSGKIGQSDPKQTTIHASRLIIVSADGSIEAPSTLLPGYNALLTWQKIMGAGGEGFWRNARNSLVYNFDKEADLIQVAAAVGADGVGEIADKMEAMTKDFQDGFDKALIGQGMSISTLPVQLPQPEQFARLATQAFASSMGIPLRIMFGNETGERASTQDIKDFNDTIEARRVQQSRPLMHTLIERLQECGVIAEKVKGIEWEDLTQATKAEQIERAERMSTINHNEGGSVFTPDEIRAAAGFDEQEEL